MDKTPSWSLPRILSLALLYTFALILILAAYRAATHEKKDFVINFEYRVF